MPNLTREHYEIIAGIFLTTLSFLLSLFMVIRAIKPSFILSLTLYSLSIGGFAVGLHGLYGLIVVHRPKTEETDQIN